MATELAYKKIENQLLERIRCGMYPPGAQLPTEHELEQEFGVSRMTVSRSMAALVHSGIIDRARGKGSFVCNPLPLLLQSVPAPGGPGMMKFISPPRLKGSEYGGGHGVLEGLHDIVRTQGHSVGIEFFFTAEDQLEILRNLRHPLNRGCVIWPSEDLRLVGGLMLLQRNKIPFVLIDSFFEELPCDCVTCDNAAGARMMLRHLYANNYRHILYLSNPLTRFSMVDRLAGVLSGKSLFSDMQIDFEILPYPIEFHPKEGLHFLQEWILKKFQSQKLPEVIFCSNDFLALQLGDLLATLDEAKAMSIALAGFDNIDRGAWAPIPLTTVAQDFFEMGRKAGEILLLRQNQKSELLAGMQLQCRIAPFLVVRDSTPAR